MLAFAASLRCHTKNLLVPVGLDAPKSFIDVDAPRSRGCQPASLRRVRPMRATANAIEAIRTQRA
jgi:hypothetical protein